MTRPRIVVAAAGTVAGLLVEWVFYDPGAGLALAVADLTVGCVLFWCAAITSDRRPQSRVGPLMALGGVTWFLGNVATALVYVHRAPLIHLHLSYPSGRVRSRLVLLVIVAAYATGAIAPLGRNDVLTIALSGAVALTAAVTFSRSSGAARKAGAPALLAALAFAGVLAFAAAARLAGRQPAAVLWVYDGVIVAAVIVLTVDLVRRRWADAVVTGLVVELGESPEGSTLRAKLARAVGDRTLVIGYRVPGSERFVDDEGRPVVLPAPGSGRTVTPLAGHDGTIAVLVHDDAVLADSGLVDSVAAAARIAVANAALQLEAHAKAVELETSRRRLLEAGDAERRRIQRELQLGPGRRLATVAALLAKARVPAVETELAAARRELDELVSGLDPTALSEGGLVPALTQLADRSPIAVEVYGSVERLPAPVEAALFFVCSEALANAAKHAHGTHVSMTVRTDDESVVVEVADDGVGGAAAGRGTGLTGLADRIATLGGTFRVDSPHGRGTTVVARLPRSTARA